MKYFRDKATGRNADIKRHRAKEKELLVKISELERLDDEMSIAVLQSYQNLLWLLQQSKADVVTRIGKKS